MAKLNYGTQNSLSSMLLIRVATNDILLRKLEDKGSSTLVTSKQLPHYSLKHYYIQLRSNLVDRIEVSNQLALSESKEPELIN